MKYVKGWVACIANKDGSRFPNGHDHLRSEPHPSEQQAKDWAAAFEPDSELQWIGCSDVPEDRLVKPLERKKPK